MSTATRKNSCDTVYKAEYCAVLLVLFTKTNWHWKHKVLLRNRFCQQCMIETTLLCLHTNWYFLVKGKVCRKHTDHLVMGQWTFIHGLQWKSNLLKQMDPLTNCKGYYNHDDSHQRSNLWCHGWSCPLTYY